jgi:hypothetical protein
MKLLFVENITSRRRECRPSYLYPAPFTNEKEDKILCMLCGEDVASIPGRWMPQLPKKSLKEVLNK